MNTQVAPAVTSLKSILSTGQLPDDNQKQQLFAFLESLPIQLLEDDDLPAQPDITSNSAQGPPVDRLVSMRDLPDITGYSRRSLLRMVQEGTFPPPIRVNQRCNRWRMSAVQQWINELETKARGAAVPLVCNNQPA